MSTSSNSVVSRPEHHSAGVQSTKSGEGDWKKIPWTIGRLSLVHSFFVALSAVCRTINWLISAFLLVISAFSKAHFLKNGQIYWNFPKQLILSLPKQKSLLIFALFFYSFYPGILAADNNNGPYKQPIIKMFKYGKIKHINTSLFVMAHLDPMYVPTYAPVTTAANLSGFEAFNIVPVRVLVPSPMISILPMDPLDFNQSPFQQLIIPEPPVVHIQYMPSPPTLRPMDPLPTLPPPDPPLPTDSPDKKRKKSINLDETSILEKVSVNLEEEEPENSEDELELNIPVPETGLLIPAVADLPVKENTINLEESVDLEEPAPPELSENAAEFEHPGNLEEEERTMARRDADYPEMTPKEPSENSLNYSAQIGNFSSEFENFKGKEEDSDTVIIVIAALTGIICVVGFTLCMVIAIRIFKGQKVDKFGRKIAENEKQSRNFENSNEIA